MTGPRRNDHSLPLAPMRRRAQQQTSPAEPFGDAEVARGQADAVLGALGRMQLRLDLMSRENTEALGSITLILEQILERLGDLEGAGTADDDTSTQADV